MNISKISAQNSAFGIKIHPWLQNKMNNSKSTFNKLTKGNFYETNIMIASYEQNMDTLKKILPDLNLRLLDTDKANQTDIYVVYNDNDNVKAKITIQGEDPCYSKLVRELKKLES